MYFEDLLKFATNYISIHQRIRKSQQGLFIYFSTNRYLLHLHKKIKKLLSFRHLNLQLRSSPYDNCNGGKNVEKLELAVEWRK